MGIGFINILVVLFIVLILFGAGKLPKVMGDLGKGIRSFREGLKGEEAENKNKLESKEDKNEQ